ncbi:hypothetical protein D3C81_1450700 [compost metagenome]
MRSAAHQVVGHPCAKVGLAGARLAQQHHAAPVLGDLVEGLHVVPAEAQRLGLALVLGLVVRQRAISEAFRDQRVSQLAGDRQANVQGLLGLGAGLSLLLGNASALRAMTAQCLAQQHGDLLLEGAVLLAFGWLDTGNDRALVDLDDFFRAHSCRPPDASSLRCSRAQRSRGGGWLAGDGRCQQEPRPRPPSACR